MALVQADRRWGGYAADANELLGAIRTYETMECGGITVLRPGDAWGLECTTGNLNPSYFCPGYYRAFAVYQPTRPPSGTSSRTIPSPCCSTTSRRRAAR
jgi:endo-1,4-beta-D-glucanase Y